MAPRVFTDDDFEPRSFSEADFEPTPQAQPQPSETDKLLGADDSPSYQAARLATGAVSKIIPFNLGDEIIAGGSALSEQLPSFLGGTGRPLGEAYDSTLEELRGYQKAAQQTSPIGSMAVDIAGGAALPVGAAAQAPTALGRIGKAAVTGAELGGAYGFGAGEGGIGNRVDSAAIGGALGLAGGATLGGVGEAARYGGKLLGKLSDKAAPLTPEEQAIAELGVTKGQLKTAGKYRPTGPMDEPALVDSIATAKQNGVFSPNAAENTPQGMLARNQQVIDEANAQANAILDAASSLQKEPVVPAFPSAEKFLDEHGLEPALKEQYSKLVNQISDGWDGTIGNLYRAKQMLQKMGFSGSASDTEKQLVKVMQHDLNTQVQNTASQLVGPEAGLQLAELGATQQQHISLRPILENSKNAAAAAALKEGGAFSLPGALKEIGSEELNQPGVRGVISGVAGAGARVLNGAANVGNPLMAAAAPGVGDLAAIINGAPPAKKLPRDWNAIKNDPQAKEAIALKSGLDPQMFSQLPEPAQKEVHKQVITSDPFSAEPSPNNFNIINGEWQNPLEKDYAVRDALGKSPSERALIIGQSFQNKAVVNPSPQATAPITARNPQDISSINSLLGGMPMQYPRASQTTPSPEMGSMLQRLEEITRIHAEDELQ